MHLTFLKDYLMKDAEVFLVARLKDHRLNYPATNDFRIFFPDLHLIGKDREQSYKFSTNHADLLARVVKRIRDFKVDARGDNVHVTVYQLGDFMDLWRQNPISFSAEQAAEKLEKGVQQIVEDHKNLISVLRGDELDTQFLLGNHDFDLHYLPGYAGSELRYFFPLSLKGPSAFVLHGDAFSFFERNAPVALKNLGVFLFGARAKPGTEDLGKLRQQSIAEHEASDYNEFIRQSEPVNLSGMVQLKQEKPEEYSQDAGFNVKRADNRDSTEDELSYLEEAQDYAAMVNKEQGWNMRFGVIGHTHRARIAVDESNGFFALIDCGGWIEKCEANGIVMPSAQIGVLYDNEACIYQLKPKDAAVG